MNPTRDAGTEPANNRRITIADLARLAGVSKATISRVLTGRPDVDDETRRRILALIASTGYSPHPAARALAQRTPAHVLRTTARFPADFLWGVGTSAYQIEGAVQEDGRGPSIWDEFAQLPGAIARGETAEVATDHYHRWRDDVALLARLGVPAYRFSVAWPRVFPLGTGAINPPGLDFYDRLVDALLERDITPLVTLYHWDLPAALQREGGWLNRRTALAFADYAEVVARRLADRVQWWITHNEPGVVASLGYGQGLHAPGIADPQAAVVAGHHLLLSHGLAVERLRACLAPSARVGIALNLSPIYAADDLLETREQVQAIDTTVNHWFLRPLFKGDYPETLFPLLGTMPPPVVAGDMKVIAAPLDFLGVNYYARQLIQTPVRPPTSRVALHPRQVVPVPGASYTETGWEVYPTGLADVLSLVHATYHPPALIVTENGAAFSEASEAAGDIHDDQRIAYLQSHIESLARARHSGLPIQGYFVWTLLDNFEWTEGYHPRFGLVAVDRQTLERRVKASGWWYAAFLRDQHAP
ncbi:MAG TPA: GH1 family beta-glucosidase [Ktedonobacterales bacterium]|nr:GH1 family beta-glucosidase [Ktedonobacterales bacterium]